MHTRVTASVFCIDEPIETLSYSYRVYGPQYRFFPITHFSKLAIILPFDVWRSTAFDGPYLVGLLPTALAAK